MYTSLLRKGAKRADPARDFDDEFNYEIGEPAGLHLALPFCLLAIASASLSQTEVAQLDSRDTLSCIVSNLCAFRFAC